MRRLAVVLIATAVLANRGTGAQAGDTGQSPLEIGARMPALKGSFLTGREAVLPDASAGKVALLALGFTYDSRFAVEAWAERFNHEFEANPAVTSFQVPMMGGGARLGRWFIDRGMRNNTPKAMHERVVTVYGGTGAWKARVGFARPDDAYLLLLDTEGRVRWRGTGGRTVDEAAYQSLAAEASVLSASR